MTQHGKSIYIDENINTCWREVVGGTLFHVAVVLLISCLTVINMGMINSNLCALYLYSINWPED